MDKSFLEKIPFFPEQFINSTQRNKPYPLSKDNIIEGLDTIEQRFSTYSFEPEFKNFLAEVIGKYEILLDLITPSNSSPYKSLFNFNPSLPSNNPSLNLNKVFKNNVEIFKEIEKIIIEFSSPSKYYVPLLRSAVSFFTVGPNENPLKIDKDIYEITTRNHYKLQDEVKIETGRDLYRRIRRIRNDIKEKRDEFEKFEYFLSESFFNNKKVDIVARDTEDPNEAHINIYIDGEDRDIHNLGDGIQSLITIMFVIFTAEKGSWIFIEEPEITLHPGFQRIFLDQLLKNMDFEEKGLKFFISTHSNHLLDLSLESKNNISIFSFERKQDDGAPFNSFKNVKNNDVDILNKLGVRNSSVFLANCSIWVEGHTDAKYINSYLKAYLTANDLASFKEDIQYSFYIYGGSNISHYLFSEEAETDDLLEKDKIKAQFLSNRIFLVADRDEGKENKHLKLLKQENPFFQYKKLPVREVENLLSVKQLKSFIPKVSKIRSKVLNSVDLQEKEYKHEYLGDYLLKKLGSKNIPKGLKEKSGTLKTYYKNKLSETAKENMIWGEMSKTAKDLAKEVYEFISKHNH